MIVMDQACRAFDAKAGRVTALDGIDLDVGEREFVAVIGRSGCGKSTLLRLIAGLLAPTGGRILVAGDPVTRPRRDVSMMFQRPALLPWRSVLANVMLPVEVLGLDRPSHIERAHELLDMVGLRGFTNRLPHELSGGMQQRVSLCRSLISSPTVMLMDEPSCSSRTPSRRPSCSPTGSSCSPRDRAGCTRSSTSTSRGRGPRIRPAWPRSAASCTIC